MNCRNLPTNNGNGLTAPATATVGKVAASSGAPPVTSRMSGTRGAALSRQSSGARLLPVAPGPVGPPAPAAPLPGGDSGVGGETTSSFSSSSEKSVEQVKTLSNVSDWLA